MSDFAAVDLSEPDRIAQAISKFCEERFQRGEAIHYLSALGVELGEDLKKLKSLTDGGLADFIRNRHDLKLEVIQLGTLKNILAVTPTAGYTHHHVNIDVSEAPGADRPRLHYRFWAAFAVPLTKARRFIEIDTLSFEDLDETTDPRNGLLLIQSDLIPPVDIANRDDYIWKSIVSWLADNKLIIDKFVDNSPRSRPTDRGRFGTSVLEAVIEALDQRQRQNLYFSVDIIEALLRARK